MSKGAKSRRRLGVRRSFQPRIALATLLLCVFIGSGCVGPARAGTESVDSHPSDANIGATFDSYIMEEFGDQPKERLGALLLAVQAHCSGSGDAFKRSAAITELTVRDRVFRIDPATCDAVYNSPILEDTPTPLGASTWDEVLQARFDRVVWWYDYDHFESAALFYCDITESGEPGEQGIHLSTSAGIELFGIVHFGDCELAI